MKQTRRKEKLDPDLALSEKQVNWLNEYLETGNATRAAVSVGYPEKSARAAGHAFLTNPYIVNILEEIRREQAKQFAATRERCIQEIAKLAFEGRSESTRSNNLRTLGEHLGIFEGKRNSDSGVSPSDSQEVLKSLQESED